MFLTFYLYWSLDKDSLTVCLLLDLDFSSDKTPSICVCSLRCRHDFWEPRPPLSFTSLFSSRWRTRLRCRHLQAPPSAPSWMFSSAASSSWPWHWPASFHLWWARILWALQLLLPWPWLLSLACWSWPPWCCPYGEADDMQMHCVFLWVCFCV